MADNVYKVIEVIGTSTESLEKAAATAVGRASKTLRDLRVAETAKLAQAKRARGIYPHAPRSEVATSVMRRRNVGSEWFPVAG
jgi:flavin-binding protein dodecin